MNLKSFLFLIAMIFSAVSLIHLVRIVLNTDVMIGSWTIPIWMSVVVVIVGAIIACKSFKFSKNN
ncbi:MAG: hypothetical protein CM1200mP1_02250 [Candidatus Neomarinimicrobiota bacterium]|nr:MAG: hypothetical protein CM1200mP1_02250 [Candidatus Neomarinimicrobiota bacterium]